MLLLIRLKSARRSLHNPRLPLFDFKGTVLRPCALAVRLIDHEPTIEALSRTQFFIADLMTDRARYSISRLFFGWIVRVERQMAEYFALAPLLLGLKSRH